MALSWAKNLSFFVLNVRANRLRRKRREKRRREGERRKNEEEKREGKPRYGNYLCMETIVRMLVWNCLETFVLEILV